MVLSSKKGIINPFTTPHYAAPHPDLPGGISPQPPLQYSAIYGGDKNPREDRKLPTWKNVNSKKTGERPPSPLLLHKTEIVVHLDREQDLELIEKTAQSIFTKVNTKEASGKIYTVTVYKEQEGESVSIYKYNTGKVKIHFITHKTQRLMQYKQILEAIGIHRVYKYYFEVYVRYHEKHERAVEETLEAILRQYAKRQKTENHMNHGKKIAYMNRVMDIEYKTFKVSIKTYRHKNYSKYPVKHPEYHPKLELSAQKTNANIEEINLNTIKTIAILLNTIINTLKLKTLHGEYEKEQEQLVIYGIDTEFKRTLLGVKKRIKAIQVTGKEYHDIRLAIGDLLVNKKLKITDIAHILGVSRIYVHKKIEELIDMGVIKRVGKGKYTWVKQKIELPKREIITHYHVRTLQELMGLVQTIRKEHKLIRVNTKGTIYIDYETEYERVRLITNVIANRKDLEIIDPITRRRTTIPMSPHKLQIL